MSSGPRPKSDLEAKRAALFAGALKYARAAALAASLVPLAQIAGVAIVAPLQASGRPCATPACLTVVPEPATLLLLAPAVLMLLRGRRK
jgi:hypothetical protein